MQALRLLSRTEGIIPAIESAHALAGALEVGRELGPDGAAPGQPLRPRRQGHGHRRPLLRALRLRRRGRQVSGNIRLLDEVLATAKRRGPGRADRLPARRLPDRRRRDRRPSSAMVEGGADIVEIGLPYSDPVLDGPVIQTADDIALRGGVRIADVLRTVREAHAATGAPVLVHDLLEPDRPLRRRAVRRRPRRGGRRGLHPARPAGRGVRAVARGAPSSTGWPPSSSSPPAAGTSGWRRSPRPAPASSTRPR